MPHAKRRQTMKSLTYVLFLIPCLTLAQTNYYKLVDSLKLVSDMPYICEGQIPDSLSYGCGDKYFWQVVEQKENIIPFLLDKLSDTTMTSAYVPNLGGQYAVADVAYAALEEIIKDIPTFSLLGVKFDKKGCGYCAYWDHLRKNIRNRLKFQANVRKWYNKNKSNLVWVTSNVFLTCDCHGIHPNGGHFELKK
jgi:hypothetical protein